MSDQTARERIADIIRYGTEDENPWVDDPGETRADAIISIVRQTLLGDSAVEASISSAGNEFVGVRTDAEDMLAAALNAAFGPAKENDGRWREAAR